MIQGRPVQFEPSLPSVGSVSVGVGLATTAVGVELTADGVAVAVFVTAGVVATVGEAGDVGEGEAATRVAVGATVPGGQAVSTAI